MKQERAFYNEMPFHALKNIERKIMPYFRLLTRGKV